MARVTPRDLDNVAAHIRRNLRIPVTIGWAYGRPRVELQLKQGTSDLSPMLPSGHLMDWMYAFIKGVEFGGRGKAPYKDRWAKIDKEGNIIWR